MLWVPLIDYIIIKAEFNYPTLIIIMITITGISWPLMSLWPHTSCSDKNTSYSMLRGASLTENRNTVALFSFTLNQLYWSEILSSYTHRGTVQKDKKKKEKIRKSRRNMIHPSPLRDWPRICVCRLCVCVCVSPCGCLCQGMGKLKSAIKVNN